MRGSSKARRFEQVANLADPGIILAAQEEHRGPLACKEHKGPNTGGNPMRSGAKEARRE
jgi:hypothetical protein